MFFDIILKSVPFGFLPAFWQRTVSQHDGNFVIIPIKYKCFCHTGACLWADTTDRKHMKSNNLQNDMLGYWVDGSFECSRSIRNYEKKIMIGTSEAK